MPQAAQPKHRQQRDEQVKMKNKYLSLPGYRTHQPDQRLPGGEACLLHMSALGIVAMKKQRLRQARQRRVPQVWIESNEKDNRQQPPTHHRRQAPRCAASAVQQFRPLSAI